MKKHIRSLIVFGDWFIKASVLSLQLIWGKYLLWSRRFFLINLTLLLPANIALIAWNQPIKHWLDCQDQVWPVAIWGITMLVGELSCFERVLTWIDTELPEVMESERPTPLSYDARSPTEPSPP